MKKVLTVARAEYWIAITSKAFLLGIAMMPLFGGGAFIVQHLTKDQVDLTPRKLAVVDETGQLMVPIQSAVEVHNKYEIYEGEGEERQQVRAEFVIEEVTVGKESENDSERIDVLLSERIKNDDLFAFAIIEKDIFDPSSEAAVRYHSQTPSFASLSNWLRNVVNAEVKRSRSESLGLSPEKVAILSAPTQLRTYGLVELDEDGEVSDAKEENRIMTVALPFGGIMLMFMMIMSVAPTMLNNVLEEKMQKISEFLVSSISPFQLMLGKLLGAVCVGLTLSTIYLGAAYSLTHYFEIADRVPPALYAWWVMFLVMALVIFGSIFSAIGAACSEIRDAQSLMTPVMLLVIIPIMCVGPVLDSPTSMFSRAISLFPPATPMLMFARIAIPPGPEAWEVLLAVLLTLLFAACSVWAAGKIFRIGILSQGQAPSFAKLVGWVIAK